MLVLDAILDELDQFLAQNLGAITNAAYVRRPYQATYDRVDNKVIVMFLPDDVEALVLSFQLIDALLKIYQFGETQSYLQTSSLSRLLAVIDLNDPGFTDQFYACIAAAIIDQINRYQ